LTHYDLVYELEPSLLHSCTLSGIVGASLETTIKQLVPAAALAAKQVSSISFFEQASCMSAENKREPLVYYYDGDLWVLANSRATGLKPIAAAMHTFFVNIFHKKLVKRLQHNIITD